MNDTHASARRSRHALHAILLLALCLGTPRAVADSGSVSFEVFALEPATFHAADALRLANGGTQTLVLLGRNDSDASRFAVYAFERGRWRSTREGPLPADAVLADTLRTAGAGGGEGAEGAESIVLLGNRRLLRLDPADWQLKPLAIDPLSTIYRGEPNGVAVADIARDLNGDGLDDIVLADFDGLWLLLQQPDGTFAEPVKAPIAPAMNQGWSVSYTAPPIYSFDYDGDGGMDFAILRDGRLQIFASADIAAGATELALPGGIADRHAEDAADADDASSSALQGIADYNGDGIVDISIATEQADGGLMDVEMEVAFYFGRRADSATIFPDIPDATLQSEGFGGVEMEDIDKDGLLDAVAISGELSVRKLITALVTQSISVEMRVYLMQPDGLPDEPSLTKKISVGEGKEPLGFADFNGDQLVDFLHREDDDGVALYWGEPTDRRLARRAVEIDVQLPFDGRNPSEVEAVDLDGDGRQDFLLRYSGPNSGAVGVLMSRWKSSE